MLLSDYVIGFLVEKEINDVFLVSGGGIMYLLDSVGRNSNIRYYCNYHEQACAIAAEGYARVRNGVGACLVTTGPGAANAISALPAAWVDSIPLLVISGQVKRELIADYDKIRQIGPQEANTIGMAKAVTKYAKSVHDPESIRYELEFAYWQATSGRPGPVLLEIPVDVQGAQIDPAKLKGYTPPANSKAGATLSADVAGVLAEIRMSKRPILICGNGIHRAQAQQVLRTLLDQTRIPISVPLTAKDIIEEDHPMNIGVFGTAGQRRANFAVQNSDCVIAIGAGLNCQKVGFNIPGFAPGARKIRKARYPLIVDDYLADKDHVNSYVFYDKLSDILGPDDAFVTGNALDTTSYFQAYRLKKGQRTLNSGWGAMGWCLPLAIGACIGRGGKQTLCITGDGSFQFNAQELLTIAHYKLPIKIFIFNNNGYSNIRGTQESFFERRYIGVDPESGVGNPDFRKLAAAYGFGYSAIATNADLECGIRAALAMQGPALCEVNISPEQRIFPKASAFRRPDGTFESRPLEDMAPFLPREEVWENMHQFDDEEK